MRSTRAVPRWLSGPVAAAAVAVLAHPGCAATASSADDFCAAVQATTDRCKVSGCTEAIVKDCGKLAVHLTDPVLNAARECVTNASCSLDLFGKCLPPAARGASPTGAQQALATEYCKTCVVSGETANCTEALLGKVGEPTALGKLILPFGDVVIDKVRTTCAATPGCGATFAGCAGTTLATEVGAGVSAETAECMVGVVAGRDEAPPSTADGGPPVAGPPPCDATSCPGCCDSRGICVPGDELGTCGSGGKACDICDRGRACSNGACIETSCKATCAGCCTAAGCQPGNTLEVCGSSGAACGACAKGQSCIGGCKVDPDKTYDVVIVRGEFAKKKANGDAWDPFGGDPDVFVSVKVQNKAGQTDNVSNTYTPTWNATVIAGARASEILNMFYLEANDSDVEADDRVGQCTLKLTDTNFTGGVQLATCLASAGGTEFKVYYKLVVR